MAPGNKAPDGCYEAVKLIMYAYKGIEDDQENREVGAHIIFCDRCLTFVRASVEALILAKESRKLQLDEETPE